MIFNSLNAVLIQTIFLAIISIYISAKISKSTINASTAYWVGWIFLEFGTFIAERNFWISEIASTIYPYISTLHYGAFIGFTLGTIIKSENRSHFQQDRIDNLYHYSIKITNLVTNKLLLLLFIIGMIFLVQRVAKVGFNINFFTNVRHIYLQRNFVFIQWIGTHIYMIILFTIIMYGVRHAVEGMHLFKIIKIIIAAAPLFLANGTRTFLLAPFIAYFASFALARDILKNEKFLISKKELQSIATNILSVLVIFAVIGFTRGGYGDNLNILYTIIIWPVSTMTAMESWLTAAVHSNSTNGLLTFNWIANFINNLGLMNFTKEKNVIDSVLYQFNTSNDSALVIPRSILPDLIFDFGKKNLFWVILLISFLLQRITLKYRGKGIFYHTLSTQCLIAAFMTIQHGIVSPGFIVILFWSMFFTLLLKGNIFT